MRGGYHILFATLLVCSIITNGNMLSAMLNPKSCHHYAIVPEMGRTVLYCQVVFAGLISLDNIAKDLILLQI